jgi:hypothetical protein
MRGSPHVRLSIWSVHGIGQLRCHPPKRWAWDLVGNARDNGAATTSSGADLPRLPPEYTEKKRVHRRGPSAQPYPDLLALGPPRRWRKLRSSLRRPKVIDPPCCAVPSSEPVIPGRGEHRHWTGGCPTTEHCLRATPDRGAKSPRAYVLTRQCVVRSDVDPVVVVASGRCVV